MGFGIATDDLDLSNDYVIIAADALEKFPYFGIHPSSNKEYPSNMIDFNK